MRSEFDNIKKGYLYSFLASFSFSEAIWVLFLAYRGMSLIEIGLLESIFHIAKLVLEIPTGIIADRFGRKTSVIASRVAAFASTVVMILSHGFWGFAVSFVLSALGYSLESGASDALIYDSLVDTGQASQFMKVKGRLEIAYQSARGLALVAGGFIATYSYELAYLLAAVVHGCALIMAWTFQEPKAGRVTHTAANRGLSALIRHCKDSMQVIRGNRGIFLYILFIETLSLFYTTLYFYFQSFLKSQGYREGSIGTVLAISAAASVVMATQTHHIERKLGRVLVIKTAPLFAIASFGLIAFTRLEPLGMIILSMVDGVLFVCFSDYINRMIPSSSRATLLSFQAMVFSVMMVLLFPLIGALSESQGFKTAFTAIFLLAAVVLLSARWKLLQSAGALTTAVPEPEMD